jgi:hypothetical protein
MKHIEYPYKPNPWMSFLSMLVLSGTTYIAFDTANTNDRGIIFYHLIELSPPNATIFYWGGFFLIALSTLIYMLAIVSAFFSKAKLTITDTEILVPSTIVFSSQNIIVQLADINNMDEMIQTNYGLEIGRYLKIQYDNWSKEIHILKQMLPNKEAFRKVCDVLDIRVEAIKNQSVQPIFQSEAENQIVKKQSIQHTFCSQCGLALAETSAFCGSCGTPTGKNTQSVHPNIEKDEVPWYRKNWILWLSFIFFLPLWFALRSIPEIRKKRVVPSDTFVAIKNNKLSCENPAIGNNSKILDSTKDKVIYYDEVPWYRKCWFMRLSLILFPPLLALILWTGESYYVDKYGSLKTRNKLVFSIFAVVTAPFYIVIFYAIFALILSHLYADYVRSELQKSACSVVTEIFHEQLLIGNVDCKVVKITAKVRENFYTAKATLDNGEDIDITIENKYETIFVSIPNPPQNEAAAETERQAEEAQRQSEAAAKAVAEAKRQSELQRQQQKAIEAKRRAELVRQKTEANARPTPDEDLIPPDNNNSALWFRVININEFDTLNMRTKASTRKSPIVYKIPFNEDCILGTEETQIYLNKVWRKITVNNRTGWVNSEFLTETSGCE